jgi:hypothetical protein
MKIDLQRADLILGLELRWGGVGLNDLHVQNDEMAQDGHRRGKLVGEK